jgi:hypothetical protein
MQQAKSSQVNINQAENVRGGIDSTIDGYTILITLGPYERRAGLLITLLRIHCNVRNTERWFAK